MTSGKPLSALYFIGYCGNALFYLDPHFTRPAASIVDGRCSQQDLATYHCESIRRAHIQVIDPSVLVGFYCKSKEDFDDLCGKLQVRQNK